MCGIVGIWDSRGQRPIAREVLLRMNESQHHRGPDETGTHVAPGVALGHKRLSIIDLATGQQPLYNEDRSVVVVYNGEIYNYGELIPELTALGHTFRTRSDTEVIVHAWEAWGEACVDRFRGMFAFALWDERHETLFLARDRLGVKPLYYAELADGTWLFGSELKALLAHGGLGRELDPRSVEDYFALGYVPEPRTIFTSAHKLAPGHTLKLRRGRPAPAPRRYWDVRFTGDNTDLRRRRAGRTDRALEGERAPAHDLRGAVGCIPVRRRRFERGGGDDGRPVQRTGEHLLDLVRRSAVRRDPLRAGGGRPLQDAALRRPRADRRLRPDRRARRSVRRAVRRQLGHSHLSRLPAGAQARHRGAVGRRRRRDLRRLPPLHAAPGRGAVPRRAAAGRAPAAVRRAGPLVSQGRLGAALRAREVHLPGTGA